MKNLLLFFVAQICMLQMEAQHFALSNDRMNVAYLGVDNPISIAVENYPCKSIVLKVKNGTVDGRNCRYIFRGIEVGVANITVYKKNGSRLKIIGEYALRVKRIPPPIVKIGPYGGNYFDNGGKKVEKVILAAQQFVRADLENFDFDAKFQIVSFSVKIFHADSCRSEVFHNTTGRISQEISDAFSGLKENDVILFNKIFAFGPDGFQWELAPLILTIDK